MLIEFNERIDKAVEYEKKVNVNEVSIKLKVECLEQLKGLLIKVQALWKQFASSNLQGGAFLQTDMWMTTEFQTTVNKALNLHFKNFNGEDIFRNFNKQLTEFTLVTTKGLSAANTGADDLITNLLGCIVNLEVMLKKVLVSDKTKQFEAVQKNLKIYVTNCAAPRKAIYKLVNVQLCHYNKKGVPAEFMNNEFKNVDSFGFAMWSRYRTYFPTKVKLSQWHLIARMTTNRPNPLQDLATRGDRELAIWYNMNKGYIHFTTSSSANNNNVQNVEFGTDIENIWIFTYFAYSRQKQRSFGIIRFPGGRTRTVLFNSVDKLMPKDYMGLHICNDKFYSGFNGQVANVNVFHGYFWTTGFNTLIQTTFKLPDVATHEFDFNANHLLPQTIHSTDRTVGKQIILTNLGGIEEYALYGWFRFDSSKIENGRKTWHQNYRVSINPIRNDLKSNNIGDKVLSLFVHEQNQLCFSTYARKLNNPNVFKYIPYSVPEFENHWVFTYFGVSIHSNVAIIFVRFPERTVKFVLNDVTHYVPGDYVEVNLLQDKYTQVSFPGDFGPIDCGYGKDTVTTEITRIEKTIIIKTEKIIEKTIIKETIEKEKILKEAPRKRIYHLVDFQISQSVRSVQESLSEFTHGQFKDVESYGFCMWSRFRTYYPTLNKINKWHLVARLTTVPKGQLGNNDKPADRTLAIWINMESGYYHFTTRNGDQKIFIKTSHMIKNSKMNGFSLISHIQEFRKKLLGTLDSHQENQRFFISMTLSTQPQEIIWLYTMQKIIFIQVLMEILLM